MPDAEFEAALPRIDGDLNTPLPPIESFDVPPPPPQDPALAEPLPPLAAFDVTTPTQRKVAASTITKTLAPDFRQRLQWQVPIILGGSVSSNRTD